MQSAFSKRGLSALSKITVKGVQIATVKQIISVMARFRHSAYAANCLNFKSFVHSFAKLYKNMRARAIPASRNGLLYNHRDLLSVIIFYAVKIVVAGRKPNRKRSVFNGNSILFKPFDNGIQKRVRTVWKLYYNQWIHIGALGGKARFKFSAFF